MGGGKAYFVTINQASPYFNLAGGVATLIAVALTLIVTGLRARGDRLRANATKTAETERQHAATGAQFLGLARVVRERLSFTYLAAARPIEGFGAFERLLDLAYSAPLASLVADRDVANAFFTALGEWERAQGSMLYSLELLKRPNMPPQEVDARRIDAIEASRAAASILDMIRDLLGDPSKVADVKLSVSELAPSVRRERGLQAFESAMSPHREALAPSLDDAKAIVSNAMIEVDPNVHKHSSVRVTARADGYDVHVISAGMRAAEFEAAIRLRLGEYLGSLRVER